MEKILLPPEFILYMSFLFYAKNGMSNELFLFIIPAITAQCMSVAIKFAGMSMEDAKKAFLVAFGFEVIAIRQMSLMALAMVTENYLIIDVLAYMRIVMSFITNFWFIGMMSFIFYQIGVMVISEKSFWMRFILTCLGMLIMGFTCASVLTVVSGYGKMAEVSIIETSVA